MIQNSKSNKSDKSVNRTRSSCNIICSEERSMTQGQSKERSRTRGSSKERRRMRGRSKERSRTRGRSKERSRTRGRSKERSRTRGYSKERNKTRGRSKERRRIRERSKERKRMRERSKGRSKDRSKMRGRSKERSGTEDPFRLVLSPELRWEYKIEKLSNDSHQYSYLLECLKHYDESKQSSKILESGTEHHVIASLSSSIKSSNKPVMIISSDDGSGKEELQLKKNSKKKSKISKNSDDEDDEEELQPKKNSKKKSKISRNSDDRNNDEELQLKKDGKKKSKPKSKNSDDEDDEEELQPKKDGKKKSKKSKNSNDEDDKEEFQPKKDNAPRRVTYHHLVDLPKDMKENLRREVKWNTKQMPPNSQLNINITFKLQKDLVTKMIIPALFKVLDTKAYPISENVLYEIIYQCHYHQRTKIKLNMSKPRKQEGSMQILAEVRRANMIVHLQLLDDPVISKLKKSELNPIVMENVYHSPEESEVDPDGDSNETCILQMFLRDYLDVLFYQQTIDKRRRKRVFDDSRYASGEDTAPLNAPR
ncbi:hypothetical protein RclHR1_16480003 [Rhizophagus clarus]|uniref:Uncharacterized protein n=1 Tax=Rhizophagus clarus TaxID=94130 RepID=A0A2Z6QHP5_9GLOM|nr:hypothetical protein RclHR1_16480003 [Rhizophagus clarus]